MPDRQHDVALGRLVGDADRGRERGEILEQELAVLEVAEHAEVRDDRQEHPDARPLAVLARTILCAAYQSTTVDTHSRITNGGFHAA